MLQSHVDESALSSGFRPSQPCLEPGVAGKTLAIVRPRGRHTLGIAANERFSPFTHVDYLTEDTSASEWSWLGLSKVRIRKIKTRTLRAGFTLYRRLDFLEENLRYADFVDVPEVYSFTSRQCSSMTSSSRKKLVVTVIETIPRHFTSLVPPYSCNGRLVMRRADLLVALTERAKRYLLSIGANENKVKVIPQGIDLDRFHPPENASSTHDGIIILLVSQLHRARGVMECLDAFKYLCKMRSQAELWIVGDGPLREIAETYAKRYPIRLFGHVPYKVLPQVYRQADIFCMPGKDVRMFGVKTFEDGQFTIAALEAMASGVPVVVTESGAYREIIEPHNLFVEQGSARSIYEAFLSLTANEKARKRIGQTNRIWMSQHFDAAIQCRKYAQALARL